MRKHWIPSLPCVALILTTPVWNVSTPSSAQTQCEGSRALAVDDPAPVPPPAVEPPVPVPPTVVPPTVEPPTPAPEPTKAPLGVPNLTITEKDNGKTVAAKKGDLVEVRLESNATTGFEWNVEENDTALLKPVGKPRFVPPAEEPLGAPGMQVFQFSALKSGLARLELHYARPWEKGKTPAHVFVVNVRIG